jgi:serine/threonine protein phosphatase PrpC
MSSFAMHGSGRKPDKNLILPYRLAISHEEMNSRRRNTMEDCHRILPVLSPELKTYSYFGIYDGHGGRQIVDFLEDGLESNLITELEQPDDASILERMCRYEN